MPSGGPLHGGPWAARARAEELPAANGGGGMQQSAQDPPCTTHIFQTSHPSRPTLKEPTCPSLHQSGQGMPEATQEQAE